MWKTGLSYFVVFVFTTLSLVAPASVAYSDPVAEFLPVVAVAGDAEQQANERLREVNRSMRRNYARTLAQVSANIDPFIVVQFDGRGGIFTLRDGARVIRAHPVPVTYEFAKSIGHAPLDVYVILAPYFDAPKGGNWQVPLTASQSGMRAALASLDESSLTDPAKSSARRVLEESIAFTGKILKAQTFSIADYKEYSAGIFDSVVILRRSAAEIQIKSIVDLLKTWKSELGADRWRNLSAAVIAPYTLSSQNTVAQALAHVMDPETVNQRLITIGGDYGNDVDVAISVFARLYLDGLGAQLTFPQDGNPTGQEMTKSLSSSRDLMAIPASEVLQKLESK